MATICAERYEEHFIDRISKYPLVHDTYGKVSDYYMWAKNKSPIMKSGLNYAEYTVQAAVSKAQPVIHKFDNQISTLDKFSCRQLDKLEEKCPIVREPMYQIVGRTRELYESEVKRRVSGLVSPVMRPVKTTYYTVSGGVSTITNYSVATVSKLSNTPPGKVVLSRLNDALDLADRSVDRFLPPGEGNEPSEECHESEAAENKEHGLAVRAGCLTTKVRRRMYSRAMKDLKQLKLRSEVAVKNMIHSVDVIEYARTHLDATKDYSDQLSCEWRAAVLEMEENEAAAAERIAEQENHRNMEIDEAEADLEPSSRAVTTDRLLASARYWAHRLRLATAAAGMVTYRHLPDSLKIKIQRATESANSLYSQLHSCNQIRELQTSFTETARQTIDQISEHVNVAFEYLTQTPLLSWLHSKPQQELIEMQTLNSQNQVSDNAEQESLSGSQSEENRANSEHSLNEFRDHDDLE